MKALVKSARQPGLWLEDIAVPEIGINDVLIRVLKTGICGTDLHIYKWDEWAQQTIPVPMAIGHEFVGRIEAVGSNVADFFPGDMVSGEGHVVCGRCRNCFAGRRHLCAHTMGVGVNRPGAFAEYIALPMTNIWRHHEGIDLDVAAIFDPFGNAVHTALSFPVLGEDVLITGAGPIGIMAAAVARHAGCHDPDGPRAGDQHVLAQHRKGERGVHRVAEGVEDGGDVEIDSLVMTPDIGHRQRDVFGESAWPVYADPHGVGAQVAPAGEAVAAAAANHVAFPADQIAREEIGDIGTHRFNPADELVADRHGHGNRLLRPIVPLEDVDVGAADAGLQYANQDVVDADLRDDDVLQPQAWLADAFDQSFHDSTIACQHRGAAFQVATSAPLPTFFEECR